MLAIICSTIPSFVFASPHSVGTNIKTSDGTIYMITDNGIRRPYNSAGAFLSYGFNNWASVVSASVEDLALPVGPQIPPQDGKIVCDTKQKIGTCYLITKGTKVAFPSAKIFQEQGFSFGKALYGDVSFLPEAFMVGSGQDAHRPGVLINKDGTIYLVSEFGLLGVPSLGEFDSWGFKLSDVVPANQADRLMSQIGLLYFRYQGELNPVGFPSVPTSNPSVNTIPAKQDSIYPSVKISEYGPKTDLYTGNQVEIFSFVVSAPTKASMVIQQIGLEYGGSVTMSSLSNIKIKDWTNNKYVGSNSGNTLTYNSGGYVISPTVTVPAGGSVEFIVYADMVASAYGSNIQTKLTQIWTTTANGIADLATVNNLPLLGPSLYINSFTATTPYSTPYPSTAKSLTVTSPSDGQTLQAGTSKQITWTLNGNSSSSGLKISLYGGTPYVSQVIATNVPNTGYYQWNIPTTISTGKYYIIVEDPNNYNVYDDTDGYFTINNPNQVTANESTNRDVKRLLNIKLLASALEMYFNDNNSYPNSLTQLVGKYIPVLPVAETPVDGTCSSAQNNFVYTSYGANSYTLTFCLGATTGGYSGGAHYLSQTGIN